jgi:ATP-dependent helicase/nuclease subunit A
MTGETGSPVIPREAPWTEEQWDAITTRHRNLLVSAAAGAGKTAVLVRRVIFLLTHPTDPLDIDRLLVVTFTDAAAAEMRDRISKALEEELDSQPASARLSRQLALVSKADISTLHSFCHKIIRQYFYRLGIDPAFRGMDDVENQLLQLEVIDDLFEGYYDDIDFEQEFTGLVDRYGGGRGDENVKDFVLRVYNFSRSRPDPDKWLSQLSSMFSIPVDTGIRDLPWTDFALCGVNHRVSMAYRSLGQAAEIAGMPLGPATYAELLREEFEACGRILKACKDRDWEAIAELIDALEFSALPGIKRGACDDALKLEAQAERNEAKKILKGLKDEYFSRSPQELVDDIRAIAPSMKTFIRVVQGFDMAYQAAKREKSLVDFADMEHLCLKVLREWDGSKGEWVKSDVAKELQDRYREVLVDEYQDINPVQNEILRFVSSPRNSFMVGDVKQSIYRFRLAEPRLFMEKHKTFPKMDTDSDNRRIDLSRNFRSRQTVIDSVNFIFRQVFSQGVGEIDYDIDAELVAGARYPSPDTGLFRGDSDNPPVEVYLIDRNATEGRESPGDTGDLPGTSGDGSPAPASGEAAEGENLEDLEALEVEARLMACRISEMVRGTAMKPGPEFQVWDKERKAYRPVSYRDIVVLMRATRGRANVLLDVFRQAGVPAYAELGTGYFEAVEVETMLSLLKIIDNPRQDIPLAAVLRSPIGGFSHDELARIRLCSRQYDFYHALEATSSACENEELASKAAGFLERLESWRTVARRAPLSALVWQLYRDTKYLDYVGGMPGGIQRQANLKAFHERARQFDRFSRQGLVRFLRFIDRLREAEGDLGTARALGESEDVVRIMSVHKSKGLEFPVVFIPDMGKQFNLQDLGYDILLHSEVGLGPMYCESERRIKYPTLAYHGVREAKLRETMCEEMRVLYVAMTRARERLVIVGSDRNLEKSASKWHNGSSKTGWGLPEEILYSARGFLDWVGSSLVRHRAGRCILQLASSSGCPADSEVFHDPSRFSVSVLSAGEACSGFRGLTDSGLKEPDIDWNLVIGAYPLGRQVDPELWQEIQNHACWKYPYSLLTERAAKVAWAEIKRRFDFSGEDAELTREDAKISPDDAVHVMPVPGQLIPRPGFLQSVDITPSERGEATHLVIQHLDLKGPLDVSGIRDSIGKMIDDELLTRELASAVDTQSICDFFRSPLGLRVKANPDMVMREVPFSLGIPASRVYPELSELGGTVSECERVLVQGIIDCIIDEHDGFVLIDFKTGGKQWHDPTAITSRYQGQISVYKEALETIYKKPVKEAYIYLLEMRKAVSI